MDGMDLCSGLYSIPDRMVVCIFISIALFPVSKWWVWVVWALGESGGL